MTETGQTIPGADAWWEKWSPVILPIVRVDGAVSAMFWILQSDDCMGELIELVRNAAHGEEFWQRVKEYRRQLVDDPSVLEELLDDAQAGMAMVGTRAPKPTDPVN